MDPPARSRLRIARLRSSGWLTLTLLAVLWSAVPALAAGPTFAPAERLARAQRLREALVVKRRHADDLLARPDVVGVGAALDAAGQPVIRVLTARPGPLDLPARLDGMQVRARVSGRIYALRGVTCEVGGDGVCESFERWPLPVPIGVSVGHPSITAGTIGARVSDGVDVFALSNNHVLAASNGGSVGDAALQPGTFDGGSLAAGDAIGTLFDFEPILFCEAWPFLCSQSNTFDAAIALTSPSQLGFATPAGEYGSVPGYGAPNPSIHPAYGDPAVFGDEDLSQLQQLAVQKHGRTTGLTSGTIDAVGVTVDVCYDEACTLVARFDDQLSIPGAFSAGGDSGSLVVSDDALHQPVALLFAGSDTESLVSRIDLVLDRFGVTIDDGGTTEPVVDAAISAFAAPPYALPGVATTIPVTVRNAGTEPLPAFDVIFSDVTESTQATLSAPALAPAAQAQLDFAWTPLALGSHQLQAALQLVDDDPGNDQAAAQVDVVAEAPGIALRSWTGIARTDAWTTVFLDQDYGDQMAVVCTPLYDIAALGPMVARVRNAAGNHFDVGLGRPWYGAFPGDDGAAEVHCVAARVGVYDAADAGVAIEVVRLDGFAGKDDTTSWQGQARSYAHAYTQPVVVGQVISPDDGGLPGDIGVWSTFWARGATSFDPPSAAQLFVGRQTAEDPTVRGPETLAYIVLEAGSGLLDGVAYVAGLGVESVRGVEDSPPYTYALPSFLGSATAALASPAGMDGLEGGWPILYGANAVQPSQLGLAIEEDWWWDPERSHTTEQVSYVVFGTRKASSHCGLGIELALVLPLVAALRRRRAGA